MLHRLFVSLLNKESTDLGQITFYKPQFLCHYNRDNTNYFPRLLAGEILKIYKSLSTEKMLHSKCPRSALVLVLYPTYYKHCSCIQVAELPFADAWGPGGASVNTCPFMHKAFTFFSFLLKKARIVLKEELVPASRDPILMTAHPKKYFPPRTKSGSQGPVWLETYCPQEPPKFTAVRWLPHVVTPVFWGGGGLDRSGWPGFQPEPTLPWTKGKSLKS